MQAAGGKFKAPLGRRRDRDEQRLDDGPDDDEIAVELLEIFEMFSSHKNK